MENENKNEVVEVIEKKPGKVRTWIKEHAAGLGTFALCMASMAAGMFFGAKMKADIPVDVEALPDAEVPFDVDVTPTVEI